MRSEKIRRATEMSRVIVTIHANSEATAEGIEITEQLNKRLFMQFRARVFIVEATGSKRSF
jgi:hypothetical protein